MQKLPTNTRRMMTALCDIVVLWQTILPLQVEHRNQWFYHCNARFAGSIHGEL